MNRRITTVLFPLVLAATIAPATAAPKPTTIEDVQALAFNPETGMFMPFTQDAPGFEVVLAVKIANGTAGSSVQVTFTATEDHSAAYNEAGHKPPPKKKIKTTRKVTVKAPDGWLMLPLVDGVSCYDDSKVTIGKSSKAISFPGTCF